MGQSTAGDKRRRTHRRPNPSEIAGSVPDWSISDVPERQCTAHKRNGDRWKNAAIRGGTVCGYHGGRAPAVKAKARLRLEMASDRLARQLLNMTTDPNVADPVKLAAIKDTLDRSGLAAKTAVSVEVGGKPLEMVFDSIMGDRETPSPPWRLRVRTPRQSNRTARSWESLTIRPTTTRSPTIRRESNGGGNRNPPLSTLRSWTLGTPRRP